MATAQKRASEVTAAKFKAALEKANTAHTEWQRLIDTEDDAAKNEACLEMHDAWEKVRTLALRAANLSDRVETSAVILLGDRAVSVFARDLDNPGYLTLEEGVSVTRKIVRLD